MGGEGALFTDEQSVSGLRKVISELTLEDSGCFRVFDGSSVAW